MNFLGMGSLEVLAILLVAFIFLGPDRMVEAARFLGKMARRPVLGIYLGELRDLRHATIRQSHRTPGVKDATRRSLERRWNVPRYRCQRLIEIIKPRQSR